MKSYNTFFSNNLKCIATVCGISCVVCFATNHLYGASMVVSRGAPAATPATRATTAARVTPVVQTPAPDVAEAPPVAETAPEPEPIIIEDKSSQFDNLLNANNTSANDSAADARADAIRRQRAALDSADAQSTASQRMTDALSTGRNACDTGLRDCMRERCGNDFSKCATDGDTALGNKMESCRRDLKCTGEEFTLFTREIRADRDHNVQMSSYNTVLDCGNRYNSCIVTQCGANFSKCLGKSAGDAAIASCGNIARECTADDSGLANRTMQVFGTLRTNAEVQVKKDEERLYALRDQMAGQCRQLGAMFDERTLDCVFTVNFWADGSDVPFASQKAYAGNSFNCDQDWFGLDITTFRENAYRLTRSQTGASSAMMGAGLGAAAGAISSGAIDRAMDRAKAEKAVKEAEKEIDSKNTNSQGSTPSTSGGTGDSTDKEKGVIGKTVEKGVGGLKTGANAVGGFLGIGKK